MSILARILLIIYAFTAVVVAERLGKKLPTAAIVFLYVTGIVSFLLVVIGDL